MTALLTASLPDYLDEPARPGRPDLRLLPAPERKGLRLRPAEESEDLCAGAGTPPAGRTVGSRPGCGVAVPSWR